MSPLPPQLLRKKKGWVNVAAAAPGATTSWGSELDVALDPPPAEDVLDLDYREDLSSVVSQDDNGSSTRASSCLSSNMPDVCKRAPAQLDVLSWRIWYSLYPGFMSSELRRQGICLATYLDDWLLLAEAHYVPL